MKYKIFSLFIVLTLLSACEGAFDVEGFDSGTDVTVDGKNDTLSQSSALTGQEIYVRKCGTCHGDDAKGAAAWPVSIEGFTPIHDIVNQGQGTMGAVVMSPKDVDKIQQFLLDLM